jgi:hypothetical protein
MKAENNKSIVIRANDFYERIIHHELEYMKLN